MPKYEKFGCGPASWKWNIPSAFTPECIQHDKDYLEGGTDEDRKNFDWKFFRAMLKRTRSMPVWRQPGLYLEAFAFWRLVRRVGMFFFLYRSAEQYDLARSKADGNARTEARMIIARSKDIQAKENVDEYLARLAKFRSRNDQVA